MKVLITGGSSLLGKYLLQTKPPDTEIFLTYHKNSHAQPDAPCYHLDIRDRSSIFELFEIVRPDLVIHCAAIGSVDFAEDEKGYQEVFAVNVTGTANVADACNGYKSKLIYVSTNAVYGGKSPPYDETAPLEPVNGYGVIKKHAERTVRELARKWLIVRPFLLYGWPYPGGRTNWAVNVIEKLKTGSCKLVDDHIWQPTYAGDAAVAIWQLAKEDHEIYNVASPERATLYEFGLKVCDVFGLEKGLISPVHSGYFPSIAPRPKDTSYDLSKLSKYGIMLSDIKTGLEKMRAENK